MIYIAVEERLISEGWGGVPNKRKREPMLYHRFSMMSCVFAFSSILTVFPLESAHAGKITSVSAPLLAPLTIDEGNDDAIVTSNLTALSWDFVQSDSKPFDVSVSVENSPAGVGPVTEYLFFFSITAPDLNTWSGLEISLLSDTPIPGLDFDTPAIPAFIEPDFASFKTTTWEDTQLVWSGITVVVDPASGNFAIDVPNANSNYDFTIRFTPIPEPATALLLMLGMAAPLRRKTRVPTAA